MSMNKGIVTLHLVKQGSGDVVDLPDYVDLSYTNVFNDFPIISFGYPVSGVNGNSLRLDEVYAQVFLKIDGVEPPNHRFFVGESEQKRAYPEGLGTVMPYSGLGVASRLLATLIYPGAISPGSVTGFLSGERRVGGTSLISDKPFSVVNSLWQEAAARTGNAVSPLIIAGDGTNDMFGQAWPSVTVERIISVGTSLWSFIKSLADEGYYNIKTYPNYAGSGSTALGFIWTGSTTFADLSNTVTFRSDANLLETNVKVDSRNKYSTVLGEGANKRYYESRDSTHENLYYRRETYATNSNLISDSEISTYFVNLRSKLSALSSTSRTVAYVVNDQSSLIPSVDYDVGNKVGVDDQKYGIGTATSINSPLAVYSYTVTVDNTSNQMRTVVLECVDRLHSQEEKQQGSIDNIEHGNTVINHGPVSVNAVGADNSTASSSYTDTGTVLSVQFTVPRSGKVLLVVSATIQAAVAGHQNFASARISGTNTVASHDDNALRNSNAPTVQASAVTLHTGLTPGAVNTATMQHRVIGGSTGNFYNRKLTVIPVD